MEIESIGTTQKVLNRLLPGVIFALSVTGVASLGVWALGGTIEESREELIQGQAMAQVLRIVRAERALGVGHMKGCGLGECEEILRLEGEWEAVSEFQFSAALDKRGAMVRATSAGGLLIELGTWELD